MIFKPNRPRLAELLENRVLLSSVGSIRGTVFNDFSGDGLKQTDESNAAGAVIYLDLNHNGKHDANEPSTVSTSTGTFAFSNLAPGKYRVAEILPINWEQTNAAQIWNIQVSTGQTTSITVGQRQLGIATLTSDHILYVTGTEGMDTISVVAEEVAGQPGSFFSATINGILQSFANADVSEIIIHGLNGNDTISEVGERTGNIPSFLYGDAGNDSITDESDSLSNPPGDVLNGGDGNDYLYADIADGYESAATTLNGGNGNDTLNCQTFDGANVNLNGDAGDDTLEYNGNVNESFSGGTGLNTILFDNDDPDTSYTELQVPADVQRVVGDEMVPLQINCSNNATYVNVADEDGHETINGGAGNDTLVGTDGFAGGDGDKLNYLNGGGGNDLIIPGLDALNYISGGTGSNSVDYSKRTGNLKVFLDGSQPSTDSNNPLEQDHFDGTVQRVFGGSGNDLIVATKSGGDALFGFGGNDTLIAQGGTDALWGGDGDDFLESKDGGKTYVDGGAGYNIATVDKILDTVKNVQRIKY